MITSDPPRKGSRLCGASPRVTPPPAREHKLPKPCAHWTLSPGPHTPRKHRPPRLWGPGGDGCGEVTPKRPGSSSQGRRQWVGSLLDEGGQVWETGCPGEAAAGKDAVQAQGRQGPAPKAALTEQDASRKELQLPGRATWPRYSQRTSRRPRKGLGEEELLH